MDAMRCVASYCTTLDKFQPSLQAILRQPMFYSLACDQCIFVSYRTLWQFLLWTSREFSHAMPCHAMHPFINPRYFATLIIHSSSHIQWPSPQNRTPAPSAPRRATRPTVSMPKPPLPAAEFVD